MAITITVTQRDPETSLVDYTWVSHYEENDAKGIEELFRTMSEQVVHLVGVDI
jgi:hypothetical protein